MFKIIHDSEAAATKGCRAMEQRPFQKRVIPKDHTSRGNNVNFHKMRKAFLIFVAVIGFGFIANAQDVILKKDGSEIRAKVLEITDLQIKYKDFDFQNGPTRNVNISDVFMITYENGQREVFNNQTSTPTTQERIYNTSSSELKNEFDRIGTDDDMMLDFFGINNFPKYYNDFASAYNMRQSAVGLLISGITITGAGIVLFAVGATVGEIFSFTVGATFLGVGNVLTIVSIPVSASAGARKKAIKNAFAREHFGVSGYTYQPTLNFNCTGNGFGISLNF